jgi:diguanylate cyclase (GGDEF)-like protein
MKIKTHKNILYLGFLLLLVFIGISVLTFLYSSNMIQNGYLASEGNAAEDFAVLTASNIHLSDAQVTALKQFDYRRLLASEENESLRQMMDNDNFISRVDYAYVMVHLPKDEVKYKVTEENKALFDAPVGTKLDIMWLLDVNVGETAAQTASSGSEMDELQRYSYYIEEDAQIFGESPTYIFNKSEWGDHICGYAPLYSTEGTYIGVVGVELQTTDYDSYHKSAMYAMGILLAVSTLSLTLLFIFLYSKYNKLQYEKIYTDSLTHIYNRSYYNNQFTKRMNGLHVKDHCFALMIADIDWFKKINDTFGHETGDQVLIELCQILLSIFGKAHVVRFGGEEFVVGIWLEDDKDIRGLLNRLYQQIRDTKFSEKQITLSISLGCSFCYPNDLNGWLLSGMLKSADSNLYTAKASGRKQYRITKFDYKPEAGKEEEPNNCQ